MGMSDRWYKNAVVYGIDVEVFMDADGDGVGDFQGLIGRLDYLARLGVNCLWLLPFYPSPNRDNGYDICDYYGVNPRYGSLGDFVEFLREARSRGMRVILDLVVNHTSDEHPWFQAARSDPDSRYRDWYVWSEEPPPTPKEPIFKGQEESVWGYDEEAGAHYYHRFYAFEPDLNIANPEVRQEIRRILGFWLQLGVSGFRVDAASHMIERKGIDQAEPGDPHGVLRELREFVTLRRGDAVLLAEADEKPAEIGEYFGEGDEMTLLFNFVLTNYLFLALARQDAEPVIQGLKLLPPIPEPGQWANFLRNLDELDLERLTGSQRQDIYEAFAPDERMRVFRRDIRRRLAPMLGGDRRRLRMAYSLLFSLPGTPVLVYGDEIGMGEDLSLHGRNAVRTPMQWSDRSNAGFSDAPEDQLARPVISQGPFRYEQVNVADQSRDPDSPLAWMTRLIAARLDNPEIGWGSWQILDTGHAHVLGMRYQWEGSTVVLLHNFRGEERRVSLDLPGEVEHLMDIWGDCLYEDIPDGTAEVRLEGYGYRWFRVNDLRKQPHYG